KATEQFGSEHGSDLGVAEGMEEGVEGGVVGGVPGGVLGGCVGCTGDGPVTDYDQAPRPIKITRPQYPQDAFIKKIEGKVVLEILIDSTGHVVKARVVQSVPMLDQAAVQTVYQWVFSPAMKKGRPVATIALAPVDFRIFYITRRVAARRAWAPRSPPTGGNDARAPADARILLMQVRGTVGSGRQPRCRRRRPLPEPPAAAGGGPAEPPIQPRCPKSGGRARRAAYRASRERAAGRWNGA